MKNKMKKSKEHFKFSFEKFIGKVGQKLERGMDRLSRVDEETLKMACDRAGVTMMELNSGKKVIDEEELMELKRLREEELERLEKLDEQLHKRQRALHGEIRELIAKIDAIQTAINIIQKETNE